MGQYWKLFNLDKCEFADCAGAKLGEFFTYSSNEKFTVNLLLSGQPNHVEWGGDRIILLGDYADGLPPNTVTDADSSLLKKCAGMDTPERDSYLSVYDELLECSDQKKSVTTTTSRLPGDTVYALRSLNKKEYVRRNTVRSYRKYHEKRTPGLAQALYSLVGWSDDPSTSLRYDSNGHVLANDGTNKTPPIIQALYSLVGWSEDPSTSLGYDGKGNAPASGGTTTPLHRGPWAGNRIDIVALTDEVQKTLDEEGWTDISGETARHISDIYACEGV